MVGNWLGSPLGATLSFAAILGVAMLVFATPAGSTAGLALR